MTQAHPLTMDRLILGLVVCVVVFLALYPVGWLFLGSFRSASPFEPGTFTTDNYLRAYTDPALLRTLWNTLIFGIGQTAFGMFVGVGLAWIISSTNTPGRRAYEYLTLILFLLPSIVLIVAWTLLASPGRGMLNQAAMAVFGLERPPLDIFSMGGMIFVQGLMVVPLVYLIVAPAFAATDVTLREAARIAGSGPFQIFFRITLPAIRPALASAAILVFILGIEAFDVPQMLGANKRIFTFTSLIYYAMNVVDPADYGRAASLSVGLQIITFGCVYFYRLLGRSAGRYETVRGKGYKTGPIDLGSAKWLVSATCAFFFLTVLGLPLVVTAIVSLVPYFSGLTADLTSQLTLINYERLLKHPRLQQGAFNSLLLAVLAGIACVALATIVAFLVVKSRTKAAAFLENAAMMPIAMPATVLAVGLLWAWIVVPLPIYGTILILGIAYVTRYLPIALRTVAGALAQISRELEEASTMSGASRLFTFRRIVLPLSKAAIFAAWVTVFMIFFREFSMSVLLAGPGSPVLSVVLYDYYETANTGVLCAASIFLVAVTMFFVWMSQKALSVATTR